MALKERLETDLEVAMRGRDVTRVSVIRILKSSIKYREIELGKPLDDGGVQDVIAAEIKRHRDSMEQFRAGNRPDLVEREEAEVRVLQGWQPLQLSAGELRAKVEEVVRRVGAQGPRDVGAVMEALLPEVQGKADGKVVSDLVEARLAGG
jgi:uncharacterized protein